MLNCEFGNIAGAMRNLTDEDIARIKDMLAELNAMIAARAAGEPYDFDGFMERYGDLFPENPRNLDELLEVMARRMAAMSRLLASMTPSNGVSSPSSLRPCWATWTWPSRWTNCNRTSRG